MKLVRIIIILFFCITVQVSFVRIFDVALIAPNLPLVALFIFCYFLPYEKILFAALFAGIVIDFFSSISFGSTSLAAIGACSLGFYLRENVLKRGSFSDFFINALAVYAAFYFLLSATNALLKFSAGYGEIFNLINIDLAGEIIIDLALSALAYRILKYYKTKKIYGFIRDIKISS